MSIHRPSLSYDMNLLWTWDSETQTWVSRHYTQLSREEADLYRELYKEATS